ncbi:uncharacterized protein LOC111707307 [Eurytemora carolleeae]|uniref:uncharacterized protein LOC111707307 n=1 Tax=Eurytemora carolleeae TaxID=1294199 RepID=UPI000C7922A5|nr:uncharacterized protein LOC111707307 [Eurytemora carolleeae]XP_023336160.1 uncharacterized protein LOC111707307 [Eurytemora carolleeae]|eukprot:XP_023336159.1 uncharacterized protein LOC111707307 [Eurytemora affinis]
MLPKPKQITLKGRGFAAGEMFSLPILKSITTGGPGPGSANVLNSMGWNGKIVGSVVLWLSNDNTSVFRGQFSLLGEFLPEPLIIPAKKLWPNVSDTISLSINLSSPDLFLYPDSLTSEYVDESDINHLFFRNNIASNSALTDEELITAEVNEISSSDTEHSPVVQPKPGARKSISRELANLAINSPAANIRSKKRESSGRPVLKPSRRKRSIEGLGQDDSDMENISDNMVPAAKLAGVEKKCQDLTNKLKAMEQKVSPTD